MQQNKITKTLGEFQKFLDGDNKTGICLEDTLRFFEIRRIFGHFECIKQRGIKVTLFMTSLLVMLFYRSRNIHSYFSRQFGKYTGTDNSKNPYYDLLGSEYICWRSILYLFAKRYLSLISRNRGVVKRIRALIFDDTVIEKSGKKIEVVSKLHDHGYQQVLRSKYSLCSKNRLNPGAKISILIFKRYLIHLKLNFKDVFYPCLLKVQLPGLWLF